MYADNVSNAKKNVKRFTQKKASKNRQPPLRQSQSPDAQLAHNPSKQYKNQVIATILTSRQNCATLRLAFATWVSSPQNSTCRKAGIIDLEAAM